MAERPLMRGRGDPISSEGASSMRLLSVCCCVVEAESVCGGEGAEGDGEGANALRDVWALAPAGAAAPGDAVTSELILLKLTVLLQDASSFDSAWEAAAASLQLRSRLRETYEEGGFGDDGIGATKR